MAGRRSFLVTVSMIAGIFIVALFLGLSQQVQASVSQSFSNSIGVNDLPFTTTVQAIFLPIAMKYTPQDIVFGVEPLSFLQQGNVIYSNTVNLPVGWVRLNGRVSWRYLQADEGAPILWSWLTPFEQELRDLKAAGIKPVVILDDYPRWATDITARHDGQPTSCGKLLDDKVDDFAAFVAQIVNRYKAPEFDVHDWELGNEPDVDPNLVAPDNEFGCWGNHEDPYYGGDAYGRMIIQVGRAIKTADPLARVWIGGLLLDKPFTPDPAPGEPDMGHPELFFEGILRSGAARYFDIVAYHFYYGYGWQTVRDFDLLPSPWNEWGGGTVGKARFLRKVMQKYGVFKPVFLNETAFICAYDPDYPDRYPWCQNPADDFNDLQANLNVRSATRTYNEGIVGFFWYTITGPGWRWGGLLDSTQNPKPVYYAYSQFIKQLNQSHSLGPVSYEDGIEAYAFNRGSNRVDVLWSIYNETITVTVPVTNWVRAFDRNGGVISPTLSGTDYLLPVGFSPVYLERLP